MSERMTTKRVESVFGNMVDELTKLGCDCSGIELVKWSPGDGVTRYSIEHHAASDGSWHRSPLSEFGSVYFLGLGAAAAVDALHHLRRGIAIARRITEE